MKQICSISLIAFCLCCFNLPMTAQVKTAEIKPTRYEVQNPLKTIAFGSCNNQKKEQKMWQFVLQNRPDLWIWLGDNIYGDTENMKLMKAKYIRQKSNNYYQHLRKKAHIIGIWDDHDYGKNDAGKEYPMKDASQQLMLNFLDVPQDAPERSRQGAYSSHTYGSGENEVKVILLDGRYFRDEVKKDGKKSIVNPTGDILGEAQWKWLEEELSNNSARLTIIGCGIQFIPEEHQYEKWAVFPTARKRFIGLLERCNPRNALLISGDRHIGEFSKIQLGNGEIVHEVTSSGLTHTYEELTDEPNQYRVGNIVNQLHFATINFDWVSQPAKINIELKGIDNKTYESLQLDLK